MTTSVKQLRDYFNGLSSRLDDVDVQVWLPGSRIDLTIGDEQAGLLKDGKLLIEGNLTPGSALGEWEDDR